MAPDQADWILAKMSVAWPGKPLTVPEVKYWVEKLQPYDFEPTADALAKIEDAKKFWPSWAEFKEFADMERRNSRAGLPRASEPVPCSPEENAKHLAEIRAALKRDRGIE